MIELQDLIQGISAHDERSIRLTGLLLEAARGVDNQHLFRHDGAPQLAGCRLSDEERQALVHALQSSLTLPSLPPVITLWALGKSGDEADLAPLLSFLKRTAPDPACAPLTHQALTALTNIGGEPARHAALLVARIGQGQPAEEAREYLDLFLPSAARVVTPYTGSVTVKESI